MKAEPDRRRLLAGEQGGRALTNLHQDEGQSMVGVDEQDQAPPLLREKSHEGGELRNVAAVRDERRPADLVDEPSHAVRRHGSTPDALFRHPAVHLGDAGARENLRLPVAAAVEMRDQVVRQVFRGRDEATGWQ